MIQILIIMFMIKSDTVARQRTGFKVQSYSKNPKNVSDFIIKSNSYIYIYMLGTAPMIYLFNAFLVFRKELAQLRHEATEKQQNITSK